MEEKQNIFHFLIGILNKETLDKESLDFCID